jgi:hypothetical protein
LDFGATPNVREIAAFSALFSSMKLMVEVITSDMMIPRKPFKSRGIPYNAVQQYEKKQIAKTLGNKNTIFIGNTTYINICNICRGNWHYGNYLYNP